jgi:hypothetical protein
VFIQAVALGKLQQLCGVYTHRQHKIDIFEQTEERVFVRFRFGVSPEIAALALHTQSVKEGDQSSINVAVLQDKIFIFYPQKRDSIAHLRTASFVANGKKLKPLLLTCCPIA